MNEFVLIPELGKDYSLIEKFIPTETKLLFLKPRNIDIVKWFKDTKNCTCTVFDSDTAKLKDCADYNIETIYGNINHDLIGIKTNSFEYVITEQDIISKIKSPIYLIDNGARISNNNLVLNFKNFAYIKNRFNFLLTGTHYSGFKDYSDDGKKFWNEQIPWHLSYKDIKNMINDLQYSLISGFYLDAKDRLENIFDIKCNPNIFGINFCFFISKDSNLVRNFSINTNILIN